LVIEGGDDALCIPSTNVIGGGSDEGEDLDAALELPMERINKVSSGGIFGTDAFLLNLPHRCRALAIADTLVWSIARSDLARMEVTHPKVSCKACHRLPVALLQPNIYSRSLFLHAHTHTHTRTQPYLPALPRAAQIVAPSCALLSSRCCLRVWRCCPTLLSTTTPVRSILSTTRYISSRLVWAA
jgi:hypothetical protein